MSPGPAAARAALRTDCVPNEDTGIRGRGNGSPAAGHRSPLSGSAGDAQDDLAQLLAALEPLVRPARLREREDLVDNGPRLAGGDEVVGALEVAACAHRRPVDRELLPPDPVQRRRRV